jgi:spore maturation protein CgeB
VSAPWEDVEGLFRPGRDFLVAEDGDAMTAHLATIIADPTEATGVAQSGLLRVHCRHTCAHRVDELLSIHHELLQSQTVTELEA